MGSTCPWSSTSNCIEHFPYCRETTPNKKSILPDVINDTLNKNQVLESS